MSNKSSLIISILVLSNGIYGVDMGCLSHIEITQEDKKSCSEKSNILKEKKTFVLNNLLEDVENLSRKKRKKVKISENLDSITIFFQKKRLKIERISEKECPPYCISPMGIEGIKTLGELETLEFIKSLKKNRGRILVDVRSALEYKRSTIPSAVNIPYTMLALKSKYRDEILKLLGVKRLQKNYYFKRVHKLLIFDNGILDNRAMKIIDSLIQIGYPKNKLLYYRGGVESWRRLGLTLQ